MPLGRRRSVATQRQQGVDDLVMLPEVKADKILDNLKRRYNRDVIYTAIGPVLVAVNPFKLISGLYGEDKCLNYRDSPPVELPPHVYAIGAQAVRGMLQGKGQAVIITGESGAGKTETAKIMLQYVAAVSQSGADVDRVKAQILQSNPILEAMGNAKTLRNNNSSRFGKYFEIFFTPGGVQPTGGRIYNYLLERSRVVAPSPGERNYHVFYMLLAGLSAAEKEALYMQGGCESFAYLSSSGVYTTEGWDDVKEYRDYVEALNVMGFSADEQQQIRQVLAAVLWLGNIEFAENANEESSVTNSDVLGVAAYLLGVAPDALQGAICAQTLTMGRSETYSKPLTAANAAKTRDSLAKALYGALFDWTVQRINEAMAGSEGSSIGVLDIFGFEIFEQNSFEQMCINYVNERLQQLFIELTLKAEQEEYRAEGIPWQDVKYHDNAPTCALLDGRPGVFSILDDSGHTSKNDVQMVEALSAFGSSSPVISCQTQFFVIKHYAGDVTYAAQGFIEKNKDTLVDDLVIMVQSSQEAFVTSQGWAAREVSTGQRRRPPTTGSQFKRQVGQLMDRLMLCTPHYIRTIKPNDTKRPNDFNSNMTKNQVRYLGLLENVKVRRAGYSFRQEYGYFLNRYGCLSPATWPSFPGPPDQGCRALLTGMGWQEGATFAMGASKVFIKEPASVFELEELLDRRLGDIAGIIQRFWKRARHRAYFNDLRVRAHNLLGGRKARRRQSLQREFRGDYVNFGANPAVRNLTNANADGKIRFAAAVNHVKRVRKKMLGLGGSFKSTEARFVMVTERSLYSLAYVTDPQTGKDGLVVHMRVELASVTGVDLSAQADGFVVVHVMPAADPKSPLEDFVFDCSKKTEFCAVLDDVKGGGLQVNVADALEARLRKGHKIKLNFTAATGLANGAEMEMRVARGGYTVMVNPGIPGAQAEAPQPISAAARSAAVAFSGPRGRSGSALRLGGSRPVPARGGPAAAPQQQQLRALYAYQAASAVELTIQEGETLALVEKCNKDWWKARRAATGEEGEVPAAYVEEVAAAPAPAPAAAFRPPPPPAAAAPASAWETVYTDDGTPYYHNPATGETRWDNPN